MRTTNLAPVILVFVHLLSFETAAQDLARLTAGDEIRIRFSKNPARLGYGTFHSYSNGVIIMTPEKYSQPINVPVELLYNIETCRGIKRNTWAGAAIGGVVGILAGTVIGSAVGNSTDPQFAEVHTIASAVLGVSAGTLVGASIGSLWTTKKWEQVGHRSSHQ